MPKRPLFSIKYGNFFNKGFTTTNRKTKEDISLFFDSDMPKNRRIRMRRFKRGSVVGKTGDFKIRRGRK
jgi:hypothetical protein